MNVAFTYPKIKSESPNGGVGDVSVYHQFQDFDSECIKVINQVMWQSQVRQKADRDYGSEVLMWPIENEQNIQEIKKNVT